MTWDLSQLQGNNFSMINLVSVPNDATGGLLVAGLLLGVFLVQTLLFNRSQLDVIEGGTLSAWLTFVYALFFSMAGLVNFQVLIGLLAIAGFGTFFLYASRS